MHARVISLRAQPGKIDDLLKALHDNVEPVLHSMEGFKAEFVLTNREENTTQTITIWDTEEHCRSTEKEPGYLRALGPIVAILDEPPDPPQYFDAAIRAYFGPTAERTHV